MSPTAKIQARPWGAISKKILFRKDHWTALIVIDLIIWSKQTCREDVGSDAPPSTLQLPSLDARWEDCHPLIIFVGRSWLSLWASVVHFIHSRCSMTPKHFLPDIHLDIIHAFFGFLGGVNSDLINGRYKYKVESFWDVQYLKKSSSGFPVWRSCNWHDSLLWWDWVHLLFIHFVLYSKMKKRWIKIFNFLSITISTITSLGMWGMNASDAEAFKESPYTLVLTLKVEETNAIWLLWKSAMCAKTLICSFFQNTFHRLYSQDDGMGVMAEYLTEGESNVFYAPFHSWGASIIKIWFNSRWWPVHAGFRMEQACCNCTSSWYWYRGPISKVFSI